MKFIFYFFIVLLCIINCISAHDQIDTLGTLAFFPINVGNKWQYKITYSLSPSETSYYSISITNYTLMPNNRHYYKFDDGSFPEYIRVDSSELKVYKYEASTTIPDSEYVYYNLTLPDTGTPPSYFWFSDTTFGRVGHLPFYRKQNIYYWSDYLVDVVNYLSQDFGLSSIIRNSGFGSYAYYDLIAARIDTSIYGQFISSINQSEKNPNFVLHQNYPNPFNQSTTIKISLGKIENIKLELFNILGQKIKTLLHEQLQAGIHKINFNADGLASGIFFYRIEAGKFQNMKKMLLMK